MFSKLRNLFKQKEGPQTPFTEGSGLLQVTTDATRCVQCGICGYNCPVGIEVREYARRGENVTDSRCISCGACIEKCPRGTVKWGPAIRLRASDSLTRVDDSLEVDPDTLPAMLELQPRKLP